MSAPIYVGPDYQPPLLKMLPEPKLYTGVPLGICIVDKDPSPGMILQSFFDQMMISKDMIAYRPKQVVGEMIRVYPNENNDILVDYIIRCEHHSVCLSGDNETGEFYIGVIW